MNKYHRGAAPERVTQRTNSTIPMKVQAAVLSHIDDEFDVAKRNNQKRIDDYDGYYDLLHCRRTTKPNDWESDIFLPEFASRYLTQSGEFLSKYFSSPDFVETTSNSDDPVDMAEAKASKKLLNAILGDKRTHYFQKIARLLGFVNPSGSGYIKGGYIQRTEQRVVGTKTRVSYVTDDDGNFLGDDGNLYDGNNSPMVEEISDPVVEDVVLEDRPVFDVWPNQAVFTSPEYTYSIQDKRYVYFWCEKTLDELRELESDNGYFNLHILQEGVVSEVRDATYGKGENLDDESAPVSSTYQILERWGKYPVVIQERDEDGAVTKFTAGLTESGNRKKNAENVECIITYAIDSRGSKTMIGFRISPHTKRPMVRFLCYVDPVKDCGFGDGEMVKELQVAINDTFNLSNYRSKLATTPAFKAKRFSGIPENVKISPEKAILLENMDDFQELMIQDNPTGAIQQMGMLARGMDYAMATNPQDMGMSPVRRETATQASFINQGSQTRNNLKSMVLEFVGFNEFYDMLLTLVNDFMLPETLEKLIGDFAQFYNPEREDRFKPVSQALQPEETKNFQMRMLDQVLGRIVAIQNPKTPMVVNMILGKMLELMGDNFKDMKKFLFEDDIEAVLLYQIAVEAFGNKGGMGSTPNMGGGGPQNQMGMPQGATEQAARETGGTDG